MGSKVLILYPFRDDLQSVMLYEELLKQGMKILYLPFRSDDEENCSRGFCIDNGKISYLGCDLSGVQAVFIRALAFSIPSNLPAYLSVSEQAVWRARFMQENIRFAALFSLLNLLQERGVLIVNHPECYYLHNTKSQFFSLLIQQGFAVPEFTATNDYQTAAKYCAQFECIAKSAYGVGATRVVDPTSLHSDCGLQQTPAIFQKKITGRTVRVHTVGGRIVLSLQILSDSLDSRSDTAGFTVIDLPEDLQTEILRINKDFRIFYSAWDVILNDAGAYYLLDCNPGPYIGWIGTYFTRYVMAALAQFIRRYTESHSTAAASDSLVLPPVQFSSVMVNHSGLEFDYHDIYRNGLRTRH